MERFYIFGPGWGTQFYFAQWVTDVPNAMSLGGTREFTGTATLKIIQGGRPGDILRTASILFLVSDKVKELVSEHNLTGCGWYSAEVTGGKGDAPTYHGFTWHGRAGHILAEESGVQYFPEAQAGAPGGIRLMERLVFDQSQWDGSDFFYVDECPRACLVPERVKEVFRKAKITNARFRPIEEFSLGARWALSRSETNGQNGSGG